MGSSIIGDLTHQHGIRESDFRGTEITTNGLVKGNSW